MRLIDVETKELHDFEAPIPPYAILSHRWGTGELNFKEVNKNRIDTTKKGYSKLVEACCVASEHDLRYLWIDTCCIDKRSSAELSEAINSMFAWYEHAVVCFAFLEDVESNRVDESFGRSVWFQRSWTLQELLAPRDVIFYNRSWNPIATKDSEVSLIAEVTGISPAVLSGEAPLWRRSFLEKMSWASGRQATRVEDTAYSLMGIFDLHMPMLYGEGERAFTRLQEEIIRHYTSSMFLLWGLERPTPRLLASSPAEFQFVRSCERIVRQDFNELFNLTNLGLQIETDLIRCGLGLYGMVVGGSVSAVYVLLLREYYHQKGMFYKVCVASTSMVHHGCSRKMRFTIMRGTREQNIPDDLHRLSRGYKSPQQPYSILMWSAPSITARPLRVPRLNELQYERPDWNGWDGEMVATWSQPMLPGIASMILRIKDQVFSLEFTFDFDSHPWLLLQNRDEIETQKKPPTMAENPRIFQDFESRLTKPRLREFGWHEVPALEITIEAGDPCLLIRGRNHGRSFARLPRSMVPGTGLWVSFVEASYREENTPWLLHVSETELSRLDDISFIPDT